MKIKLGDKVKKLKIRQKTGSKDMRMTNPEKVAMMRKNIHKWLNT